MKHCNAAENRNDAKDVYCNVIAGPVSPVQAETLSQNNYDISLRFYINSNTCILSIMK